jgi:hypothetical protein
MKKTPLLLLACLLIFLLFGTYTFAADESIHIELQIGQEELQINGSNLQVEKPYIYEDSTLVPLRVITTAFGSSIKWDDKTKTIEIKYGDQTIILSIDSMEGLLNGDTVQLPVAPQLTNGTTMVPLRFISETFGAKVEFEAETQKIKITGTKKSNSSKDLNAIDEDAGKTHIGSSYYQWTMKYPSGLIKSNQGFKEDWVDFKDAKDEYFVDIYVDDEQEDKLSAETLLKYITEDVEGTIIDKVFVTNAKYPYAKIVTKDNTGQFTEYRAFQVGNRLFGIILLVQKEEDYKNPEKYAVYKDLLDSFVPEFEKSNPNIKDLSTVRDGYREYVDADNGLSMKVPANWSKTNVEGSIIFYNYDERRSIQIRVTSVVENDTLDQWVQRENNYLRNLYLPQYQEIDPIKDIKISNRPAELLRYTQHAGDNKKSTIYGTYTFVGNYKYEIDFIFENNDNNENLVNNLLESIKIDKEKIKLGTIHDDRDFRDQVKSSTVRNKEHKFTMEIPDNWTEKYDNRTIFTYSFSGGVMKVFAANGTTVDELSKALEANIKRNQEVNSSYQLIESKTTAIAGMTAKKLVIESKAEGITYVSTSYLVERNGTVYLISLDTPSARRTPHLLKIQEEVINSLKFN